MKNAFTLIEIIFVIVIIGIISATAVLKLTNLKYNSKVITIINTTKSTAEQALESAQNRIYLEDNDTFKLNDLVSVKGKGWKYNASYKDGDYYYPNKAGNKSYAYVVLDTSNRQIIYRINCSVFENEKEQEICERYNDDNSEQKINY